MIPLVEYCMCYLVADKLSEAARLEQFRDKNVIDAE
jgi:hypothetical protein